MVPQRYLCAPIAALLLAGASLTLLPARAPAQDFSAGLKMGWHDGNDWIDRRIEENRHHFDRRRFEEAHFEMERAFEDRHDRWHEKEFDRREHHDGFTAGLKFAARESVERDRVDPHSRVAEGARNLFRPADESKQKNEHHAHNGEQARDKMDPVPAKNGQGENANHQPSETKKASEPARTNAIPANSVGNRVANNTAVNAAAPGVAKNGPGNETNRQAGNAPDPVRANVNNDPPVKAAAPGVAKNGPGNDTNRQVGKAFDPARANVNNDGPGNLVGNRAANEVN